MTDLEITKLCAEAMGYKPHIFDGVFLDLAIGYSAMWVMKPSEPRVHHFPMVYDPLHDDAQAMALVKRFGLDIARSGDSTWFVDTEPFNPIASGSSTDLNRAICECVANMQQAK